MATTANSGPRQQARGGAGPGGPVLSARSRRRQLVSSVALLVAGVVALSAALSPWWYTRTSSAGASSTAEFYPGGSFYAGGGGGGGTTTYAAYGLSLVGALYEGILAGSAVLTVLAWAGAGQGFLRWARQSGPDRQGLAIPPLVATGLSLAAGLLLVDPLAQPLLYRSDDPGGSCTVGSAAGPCSSFWGSVQSSGVSRVWGAGQGWWLDLGVVVLFALVVVVAGWRDGAAEGPPAVQVRPERHGRSIGPGPKDPPSRSAPGPRGA